MARATDAAGSHEAIELNFDDYFEYNEKRDAIGSGSFGKVYTCHLKAGVSLPLELSNALPDKLCVKVCGANRLAKNEAMKRTVEREYNALIRLYHPYIVRCVKMFYDRDPDTLEIERVLIVMERAPPMIDGPELTGLSETEKLLYGGPAELFRYIVGRGRTSEAKTRFIMYQLLAATHYLHTGQPEGPLMHRDLKTENVLVIGEVNTQSAGLVPKIKLADFGTARILTIEQRLSSTPILTKQNIGSKQYMAPEFFASSSSSSSSVSIGADHISSSSSSSSSSTSVTATTISPPALLKKSTSVEKAYYDEKIDIYSLGVTMFAILTAGRLPYAEDHENGSKDSIWIPRMKAKQVRYSAVDSSLSKEGRDILRWMLHIHPSIRFSSTQCLAHAWFDPIRDEVATIFQDDILKKLRRQV